MKAKIKQDEQTVETPPIVDALVISSETVEPVASGGFGR